MNKKNKGFTTIELITSFTLASVIMLILFNIILILKDNLSEVNAKTNMLVEKDNLSYNINKRFKEKELSSVTLCNEGDKCYEFTYSDSTSDKLIYSNTDKTITFNNYTFDIIDGITVEEPVITEHYDTMSSTTYNGYFIINIPIKIDNKDYSIKINKHFNSDSVMVDVGNYYRDSIGNKYIPVEYLESTGTQYIDTGYYNNQNTKIDISFIYLQPNTDPAAQGMLYGSAEINNGRPSISIGVIGSNNDFYYRNSDGSETFRGARIDQNVKYYISVYKNKIEINNNLYSSNMGLISNKSIYSSYLFARHQPEAPASWQNVYINDGYCPFIGRIYYCKIYDNDTLARDYIPVIDSTERPCLFDKVSRECYYNQGTGEFLYG